MRNTLTKVVAFAAGAAIGSAVTWKLIKTKYERIAQEEIDSVKEMFANRQSEPTKGDTESESFAEGIAEVLEDGITKSTPKNQLDIKEYAEQIQGMNYTNYSNGSVPLGPAGSICREPKKPKATRIIRPEEFDELEDYDCMSLTYYSDGVLVYENDTIVEDADNLIGIDPAEHFGEYEDDSVFVRNDELKRDFEILLDPRKYSDVVGSSPHEAEDEWDETS